MTADDNVFGGATVAFCFLTGLGIILAGQAAGCLMGCSLYLWAPVVSMLTVPGRRFCFVLLCYFVCCLLLCRL